MQMYDPKREYSAHKVEIDRAIHSVLDHGIFINGPEVKNLENNLSKYIGAKCVAVSNGTDALKVALLALGVSKDDEVITVAHSWISTVEGSGERKQIARNHRMTKKNPRKKKPGLMPKILKLMNELENL